MTVEDKPWTMPLSEGEDAQGNPVFATEYAGLALDFSEESGTVAITLSEDALGRGDKDLGRDLLRGFFAALEERRLYPRYLVLLNSAVFLAAEDAETLAALCALEKQNVSVLVSEESVDFYELRGKIRVGTLSVMAEILATLFHVDKVINF